MEVKVTCPLGSECEKAKDGYIERCAWYTKLVGKDPQSNKDIDEWGCAMAWMPVMLVENAQTNRGQTEAICSMRDEGTKRQDTLNNIMGTALQLSQDKNSKELKELQN